MKSQHLLVFPYPAQGHMLPMLDFTHHLASYGFTLTLLVTPKNLAIVEPLLATHPSINTLVLPMPPHPKLLPGVENVRDIGNHGNKYIMLALRDLHQPISSWFNSHPSPPVAIVSDFFLGWTHHLATQLGIPRLVFYGVGALAVNVIDYCWLHVKTSGFRSSPVVQMGHLPTSPSFRKERLPSVVMAYTESDPDWDLLRDDAMANTSSWACLLNTCGSLEHEYLDHLRKTREGCVFGVGPLNLSSYRNGHDPIQDPSSILTWLDEYPDESVLYICFGSQMQLNKEQTEALAWGLERSGTRFVWVVKVFNEGASGFIPVGFEERVSGRGIVVKEWAPQMAILNHRAVGGFLSHCGWNSVLESIGAGVMILGWPMEAEQFVNARLLTTELGMAVTVCEGAKSVPESEELGRVIEKSMSGKSPEKAKAKELRKEAVEAVGTNGSSWRDMEELVNKLAQLRPTTSA